MKSKTAMMEFIADQTGDVFVRVSPKGIVRYVSGSVRWLGHDPQALIGTNGIELVHPEDRATFLYNTQSALKGEAVAPASRVHRFRTGDGRWIWMEGNPRPILNRQGRIIEMVNVFRDVTERKAMEAAAQAQAKTFQAAFEHAGVGKAMVGLDGTFLNINQAFCNIVDYPRPVMLKLDFQTITHPEDLDADLDLLGRLSRGEISSYRLEKRYIRSDKAVVWVDLTVSAMRGEDGAPQAYLAQVQDITARREAEAALRDNEMRFRLLAENSSDIIACFDRQARFSYLSPSVEKVLGYRPDELIGQATRVIMHPEDYKASLQIYAAHLSGPAPTEAFHFEYRAFHKDGRTVRLAAHPRALFDEHGEVTGFQDVVRDVTQRRAMEAALAQSEARFRLLAENASDLVMEVRPDGAITYVSPSSVALTGFSLDETVGHTAQRWVHPDDWGVVVQAFQEQVQARGVAKRRVIEYRVVTKDGGEIWLESSPRANVDPSSGEVLSVTDAARDVTARRALEDSLSVARDEAERAAQVKADFMANMSHEIRTPLTAILGFTSLLRARADLPDEARGQVERVAGAGQALLAIVNDVLDFSKLEAGQMPIKARPASLRETLCDCAALFEPQVLAKGLTLAVDGAATLPIAQVDPDRLRQVLLNLIGNAVKFTESGGVTLACAYDEATERLAVEVTDTGPGMSEEDQAKLFQRFSQVDASTTRRHGGTGLGLAICRGLVEAMGGEIGLRSRPGVGSTFSFHIHAPRASDLAADAPTGGEAALAGVRVLVADDNPVNRELARALLTPFGAEVQEAKDGREATELAEFLPFDVILMDIRMPECDGPDAALRIRGRPGPNQNVPILAFTADYDLERYGEQAGRGFDGVVRKPIIGADLIQAVAGAAAFDLDDWLGAGAVA